MRTWREIKARRGKAPEDPERLRQRVAELAAEHDAYQSTLAELRKARSHTQMDVAAALGITQSEVSKLERRTDLYLSTLERYVQGLGGRLELTAVFGEERFVLKLNDLVADEATEPVPYDAPVSAAAG